MAATGSPLMGVAGAPANHRPLGGQPPVGLSGKQGSLLPPGVLGAGKGPPPSDVYLRSMGAAPPPGAPPAPEPRGPPHTQEDHVDSMMTSAPLQAPQVDLMEQFLSTKNGKKRGAGKKGKNGANGTVGQGPPGLPPGAPDQQDQHSVQQHSFFDVRIPGADQGRGGPPPSSHAGGLMHAGSLRGVDQGKKGAVARTDSQGTLSSSQHSVASGGQLVHQLRKGFQCDTFVVGE